MSMADALDDALAILDGATRMPRCAACARTICDHSDLQFAGLVPTTPSAAAPFLPGGSGRADRLPQVSAPIPTQPIHDRRDQIANVNPALHEGVNR